MCVCWMSAKNQKEELRKMYFKSHINCCSSVYVLGTLAIQYFLSFSVFDISFSFTYLYTLHHYGTIYIHIIHNLRIISWSSVPGCCCMDIFVNKFNVTIYYRMKHTHTHNVIIVIIIFATRMIQIYV